MTPPKMSADAVQKATGHSWDHWFSLLDDLGAKQMSHKAIADHLHTQQGVSGWWAQSITVAYERARGMREVGETTRGFQASRQKTFLPNPAAAWELLISTEGLGAWLGSGAPDALHEGQTFDLPDSVHVEVRTIRAGEQLRLGWTPTNADRTQVVIVWVTASASGKGTIGFTHENLPDADARESARTRWSEALNSLQALTRR
ncbi:hypothetical protein FRC98_08645 [Lujinxingia vulgaris]|uniref:SRPBCC domain-containing protein n=1 Tax=Lujinxingia vulgaris TaxID=2600176 RepID=A0A5C6XEH5_9DELT|nr:hypothetical protein [Lujinxingia vulgaris]TXD37745.1 hypothetical protein FRC98_08645 [Lujinxingia vulgaris]